MQSLALRQTPLQVMLKAFPKEESRLALLKILLEVEYFQLAPMLPYLHLPILMSRLNLQPLTAPPP